MDRAYYIFPHISITRSLLMRAFTSSKGDDVHIYFNFSIKLVEIGDFFFLEYTYILFSEDDCVNFCITCI